MACHSRGAVLPKGFGNFPSIFIKFSPDHVYFLGICFQRLTVEPIVGFLNWPILFIPHIHNGIRLFEFAEDPMGKCHGGYFDSNARGVELRDNHILLPIPGYFKAGPCCRLCQTKVAI